MQDELPDEPRKSSQAPSLSIKEACAYLGISEQTMFRWMKEGKVTYWKIGDATRFREEDLQAVIEKHTSEREAAAVKPKCAVCGHSDLIPGKIASTGLIYFKPYKTRFWTLRESNVKIEGRTCPRCGYVHIFADTTKLKSLLKSSKEKEAEESA